MRRYEITWTVPAGSVILGKPGPCKDSHISDLEDEELEVALEELEAVGAENVAAEVI